MDDNKTKYHNGAKSKGNVLAILKNLKDQNILRHCSSDYRCGYAGMTQTQFYAPFFIEFPNGYCWILFPSNSIRSDRMNIQQWNAEHIKRINKNVTRAYLVVPDKITDNCAEQKIAEQYDERLRSNKYYTAIDGVIYQNQIELLCKEFNEKDKVQE